MSRPYQHNFDSGRSPHDRPPTNSASPNTPSSAGGQPWRTNINRAKTKRWAEAKSISYDGDDWGDGDEYDEDDEPVAHQEPAGLRSQGQPMHPTQAQGARYGDLMQAQSPGPQPTRNATNPPFLQSRGRGSFDQGDDRRAFSSGHTRQPSYDAAPQFSRSDSPYGQAMPARQTPPPLHVQTQPTRSIDQEPFPQPQYPSQMGAGRRSQSGGRPSPADVYNRRESPSRSMNQPMSAGGYSSREASPGGKRFPPRKSSLSQESGPMPPFAPGTSTEPGPHSTSVERPASRDRTLSGGAKALPFIRPADIYKRMEEEREKERRRSQESSRRPSMDSTRFRPEEATEPMPQLQRKSSSESLGRTTGRRPSWDGSEDPDSSRRLQPILQPVAERKSEYGFDNLVAPDTAEQDQSMDTPRPSQQPFPQPIATQHQDQEQQPSSATSAPDPTSASSNYSGNSIGSSLPGASRLPNVGSNYHSPVQHRSQDDYDREQRAPDAGGSAPLQHNPSLGLRSVVYQAFDQPEGRSVPPTPSSSQGDSVVRSDSASTSEISPIISRNTGAMTAEPRSIAHEVGATIIEERNESRSRPTSSGTVTQSAPSREHGPLPPPFKPGHRRDTSTPSPGNSPARRPRVETGDVPRSELGEVGHATPTDARGRNQTPLPLPDTGSPFNSQQFKRTESPLSRSESPSKGSVRDLATRFEGQGSDNRSRSSSPMKTPRPTQERFESFRPSLPGGWNSYATTAGPPTPQPLESQFRYRQAPHVEVTSTNRAPQQTGEIKDRTPSAPLKELASEPSNLDPIAAATAAGAALAGAFTAATGIGKESDDWSDSEEESRRQDYESPEPTRHQHGLVAPKPYFAAARSAESSAPPTPPPKDTPLESITSGPHQGYFSSIHRAEEGSDDRAFACSTPPRPPMLHNMSTETSPQDLESDRLRKEIMRSLSPRTTHMMEPQFPGTVESAEPKSTLQQPPIIEDQVESTALPAEYDSYWNDNKAPEHRSEDSLHSPYEPGQSSNFEQSRIAEPIQEVHHPSSTLEDRPTLKQRFSWEEAESPQRDLAVVAPLTPRRSQEESTLNAPAIPEAVETPSLRPETNAMGRSLTQETPVNERDDFPGPSAFEDHATGPEGISEGFGDRQLPESPVNDRDSFEQHDAEEVAVAPAQSGMTGALDASAVVPAGTSQGKILSFKEILQMKTPQDRIRAYNTTREHFATSDTGLENWIQMTGELLPEHAAVVSANGRPATLEGLNTISPSRSKFPRIVSLGGATGGSEGAKPPHNRSVSGVALGSMRLPTQQVQERGKDMLHTAGKFSGKAGGAAKGLFAKGKSRFRTSGGGDKAISSAREDYQPIEPHSEQSSIDAPAFGASQPLAPAETSDEPHLSSTNDDSDYRASSTERLGPVLQHTTETTPLSEEGKKDVAKDEPRDDAIGEHSTAVPANEAPRNQSRDSSPGISEHVPGRDSVAGHSSGIVSEVEPDTEAEDAGRQEIVHPNQFTSTNLAHPMSQAVQTRSLLGTDTADEVVDSEHLGGGETPKAVPPSMDEYINPAEGIGGVTPILPLPETEQYERDPVTTKAASAGHDHHISSALPAALPPSAIASPAVHSSEAAPSAHKAPLDARIDPVHPEHENPNTSWHRHEVLPDRGESDPRRQGLPYTDVQSVMVQNEVGARDRGLAPSEVHYKHRSVSPLPSPIPPTDGSAHPEPERGAVSPPPFAEQAPAATQLSKAVEAREEASPSQEYGGEATPVYRNSAEAKRHDSAQQPAEWARLAEQSRREHGDIVSGRERPFSFVEQGDEELNRPISQRTEEQTPLPDQQQVVDREESALIGEEELPADPRPKSYSRPFQDSRLQEHPAYRLSREEPPRAMVYATESPPNGTYPNPYSQDTQHEPARHSTQSPPLLERGRGRGYGDSYGDRPMDPSRQQTDGRPMPQGFDHDSEGLQDGIYSPASQPLHSNGSYLPRNPVTEYQLPGVGPPPPIPPSKPKSRRGSMIFRSRSKSRSRGNTATAATADDESENYEQPEVKSKRRSSIFRSMSKPKSQNSSRNSTPQNGPGSREDLLQAISPAAYTVTNNALAQNGARGSDNNLESKKLQRASTSNVTPQEAGKKKGFSRFSGLFGRSGTTGSKPKGSEEVPEKQHKLQKPQQLVQQSRPPQQLSPRQQMTQSPPPLGAPQPQQQQRQQMPSSQESAHQQLQQRHQVPPGHLPPQQPAQSQQQKPVQRWSTLSNYPPQGPPQSSQHPAPSRQMSVPTQPFVGRPPPVGGYYAPQNDERSSQSPHPPAALNAQQPPQPSPPQQSSQQSPEFLGGRRLSEQRLAENKHNFESENGFRGPYHPALQPQGYPPNLRINTQNHRRESPQPQQVKSAQPRLEPTYGRSPYGSNRTGRSLSHQNSFEHARELHRRSRSPRAGPRSPSLDEAPESAFNDPAHVLGTFRTQNNSTPRLSDQEKPWSLSIPEEEYDRRRLTDYRQGNHDRPSNHPLPSSADMMSPVNPAATGIAPPPPPKVPLASYQNQNMQRGVPRLAVETGPVELPGSRVKGDEESDEIVMSSTAYPGQEWMPENFGAWDGD